MTTFFARTFFFILLLSSPGVFAQPGFQRLYGGVNQEISLVAFPCPSGGIYYLGATTSTGNGDADPVIMKLDDNGNVIWAKAIGGVNYDVANEMVLAQDGGLVCAGSTKSYNGNTADDLYFFKTDSMGNMQWAKTFSTPDLEVASAILRTADGGYAITGYTRGTGLKRVILIRTDANGDTLYARTYGGNSDDQGVEFMETADGGFMITGKAFSQSLGESDILLMRTDVQGNLLWAKSFGGVLWDEGAGITRLMDGNYLISGSTISFGQGNFDILLLKTDTTGNILWGKTYGGAGTDASYTARENGDGNIVVSGYTNSMGYGHSLRVIDPSQQPHTLGDDSTNVFLMKVNSVGDTLWTRTYGDGAQDEAFHFAKINGGYIVGGFSTSYTNATDSTQMMLIRTDSLGYSGCHERDGHPIIDTTNFITQTLAYTQTSGITMNIVTSQSLVWNITAEDACLYIAVPERSSATAEIFPNPASTLVNIKSEEPVTRIEFYNLPGACLFKNVFSVNGQEETVDVSSIAPGIYFLKIITATSETTKKIIIQN